MSDSSPSRGASFSEPQVELGQLKDVAQHLRQIRSTSLRGDWDSNASSPMQSRSQTTDKSAWQVVDFAGDMDDLLRACADAPIGTVFDLGGATVTATMSLLEAVTDEAPDSGSSNGVPPQLGKQPSSNSSKPGSLLVNSASQASKSCGSISGGSNEGPGNTLAADAAAAGTHAGGPTPSSAAACWSSVLAPDSPCIKTPGLDRLRLESQDAVQPCDNFPGAAPLLPAGVATSGRRLPQAGERRMPWQGASLESTGSILSESTSRRFRHNTSFGASECGSIASQPSEAYVSARTSHLSNGDVTASTDALESTCKVENLYASHIMTPPGVAPQTPPILALAGSGIAIQNGSLHLPAYHMLVIEGADVTLEDLKIAGDGIAADPKRSLPLVFISHGSVTFKAVSVCRNQMGHGVGVGAQGSLEMFDCELEANRTSGLVVRGDSATVLARGTRFAHNGQDGATVSAGALCEFKDCRFRQNAMLGLGVSGGGSSSTVTRCLAQRNGSHGFVAHRAASLTLNNCSSTGNAVGVLALGAGTEVNWVEGSVMSCRQGMHVCEGAQAKVVNGDNSRNDIGFCVSDAASKLHLENCSVISARTHGVQIVAGGVCTMSSGCTVTKSTTHGAVVQHKHSRLVATDTTFQLNGAAGVHLSIMSQADLSNCSLKSNKVAGLQATDTGTKASMQQCKLVRNATIGAFVNKGANCVLNNCQLESNGSSGCEVRDRQSSAVATSTAFTDNGRVGIYAHSSATVELHECALSGNQAFELLCGGRDGADIGGGTTTYCPKCKVTGGTMVRHGGRIFQSAEADTSAADNELPAAAAAAVPAAK